MRYLDDLTVLAAWNRYVDAVRLDRHFGVTTEAPELALREYEQELAEWYRRAREDEREQDDTGQAAAGGDQVP